MSLETIYARRSIRQFTNEAVTEGQAEELLKAAMAAPSGRDMKPWHFVVVEERETLGRIADAHPYGKMIESAALCIAVLGDPAVNGDYWIVDCAAATQNILLAATALGLGSCWVGVFPREERKPPLQEVLGVPDDMEICSLVAIGHPAESKPARTQYDPARIHRERW
jgi:nitroreductase